MRSDDFIHGVNFGLRHAVEDYHEFFSSFGRGISFIYEESWTNPTIGEFKVVPIAFISL